MDTGSKTGAFTGGGGTSVTQFSHRNGAMRYAYCALRYYRARQPPRRSRLTVTPSTDRAVAGRHDVVRWDRCGMAARTRPAYDTPTDIQAGAMTMSKPRMRIAAICQIMMALAGATAAHAAQAAGPCRQIVAACQEAGFTQGGARTGDGIQVDCVRPIMQGTAQPRRATKPLPQIDPQIVAACKARNPDFGQRDRAPDDAAPPSPPP